MQDRRGDPPGSLQEGLPHVRHGRYVWRGRRSREAAGPKPGASRAHARDRRELGVGHPRELRQHDEATARRPRGAERRRRGRARCARLHGRKRRTRSALGILPNVQPRRRLRPRADRRHAWEPARDRLAGRLDQAVPVRRARASDDGRDAPPRDRERRETGDDQGNSGARGLQHLEPAALRDREQRARGEVLPGVHGQRDRSAPQSRHPRVQRRVRAELPRCRP